FEMTLAHASISLIRNAAYLTWRYGPGSPHAGARIGVIPDRSGELVGYVVAWTSPSNEKAGVIFDLHAMPRPPPETFSALLTVPSRRIRSEGGRVARMQWIPGPTSAPLAVLRANHFVKRAQRHELLVKFQDEAAHAAALDPSIWSYSYGDAEASHA